MVDIHSHIIPAVDDGSRSLDESLKILDRAMQIGITQMSATPHVYDIDYDEGGKHRILNQFDLLKNEAIKRNLPIELHLGYEIHLSERSASFIEENHFSYNGSSRYALIEMPETNIPSYLHQVIFEMKLSGIIPVIAHPERNLEFQRKQRFIGQACEMGALLQMDAGSLLGSFGEVVKQNAKSLLQIKAVNIVASDVHNLSSRRIDLLLECRNLVHDMTKSEDYTNTLFTLNPKAVLDGTEIIQTVWTAESRKSKSSLLTQLKKIFNPAAGFN